MRVQDHSDAIETRDPAHRLPENTSFEAAVAVSLSVSFGALQLLFMLGRFIVYRAAPKNPVRGLDLHGFWLEILTTGVLFLTLAGLVIVALRVWIGSYEIGDKWMRLAPVLVFSSWMAANCVIFLGVILDLGPFQFFADGTK